MQTILSRRAQLAVVAVILLVMGGSTRAIVPERPDTPARSDVPIVQDPGAIAGREFAPGQVIVKFKEKAAPEVRADVRS